MLHRVRRRLRWMWPLHTLAQQRNKIAHLHRRRDEHALAKVTTHQQQRLQVSGVLDPLGNGGAAETMREIDRRLANCGITRVHRAVGDKAAIELDLGKWQFAQPRERRISGPEIVDRDANAVAAKLPRNFLRKLDVAYDLILAHLENDAGPV